MAGFIRLGTSRDQSRYVNVDNVNSIRFDETQQDTNGNTHIYLEYIGGTVTHFPISPAELANLKETFDFGDLDLVQQRLDDEAAISAYRARKYDDVTPLEEELDRARA